MQKQSFNYSVLNRSANLYYDCFLKSFWYDYGLAMRSNFNYNLVFDILITLGVISVLGKFYNVQFNIPIITALLTILGYTINDKVIVFDRVREFKKASNLDLPALIDQSLNQIFIRSISTGSCTLLMLFSVFILGEETLKYFALTLIIGVTIGTLSSLFLAPLILFAFAKKN